MKLDTLIQRISEKGIDLLLQILLAIVIWTVGSYLIPHCIIKCNQAKNKNAS